MPTMHEDGESVFAAIGAGARGFILKGAEQQEVVGAGAKGWTWPH